MSHQYNKDFTCPNSVIPQLTEPTFLPETHRHGGQVNTDTDTDTDIVAVGRRTFGVRHA
jgi:hypothetical protein